MNNTNNISNRNNKLKIFINENSAKVVNESTKGETKCNNRSRDSKSILPILRRKHNKQVKIIGEIN